MTPQKDELPTCKVRISGASKLYLDDMRGDLSQRAYLDMLLLAAFDLKQQDIDNMAVSLENLAKKINSQILGIRIFIQKGLGA